MSLYGLLRYEGIKAGRWCNPLSFTGTWIFFVIYVSAVTSVFLFFTLSCCWGDPQLIRIKNLHGRLGISLKSVPARHGWRPSGIGLSPNSGGTFLSESQYVRSFSYTEKITQCVYREQKLSCWSQFRRSRWEKLTCIVWSYLNDGLQAQILLIQSLWATYILQFFRDIMEKVLIIFFVYCHLYDNPGETRDRYTTWLESLTEYSLQMGLSPLPSRAKMKWWFRTEWKYSTGMEHSEK